MSDVGAPPTDLAVLDERLAVLSCTQPLLSLFGVSALPPGTSAVAVLSGAPDLEAAEGERAAAWLSALQRDAPAETTLRRTDGQRLALRAEPLLPTGWTLTVTGTAAPASTCPRAGMPDAILAALPQAVCMFDADNRVTLVNPAWDVVMDGVPLHIGETRSEMVRRMAYAGELGPGDPEVIITHALGLDLTRRHRSVLRRPNGKVVEMHGHPLPQGGRIMVCGDITSLTAAETAAEQRAAQIEVMLSHTRHGVLYWGPDRRLVASNQLAADLLGHPPGRLVAGRHEDELLDDMLARDEWGSGESSRVRIETLRRRDRSIPYRRYLTTKAGRVLDARSDPVPGGGWITTFSDVTEMMRAQQELRAARDAAEAANRAKSRFLATMSHELRTPLNAVIGFSDALLREGRTPAPGRVTEFAQQINDAGRQLLALINIVLDVARIEAGRFDLTVERVDPAALVRDAVRRITSAAQAADIALEIALGDDLPELRADEQRLQQVMAHLLSNAVKFTNAGGTITVGAETEADGGLLITVRDTGIGIPEAELEHVFEPFTQVENSHARRFQGAGIGLYVARALVLGHGGSLALKSKPGKGTTAELRLPHTLTV